MAELGGIHVIPMSSYQDTARVVESLESIAKHYVSSEPRTQEEWNRLHEAVSPILWGLSYHIQRSPCPHITEAVAQREDLLEMLSEGIIRTYLDGK